MLSLMMAVLTTVSPISVEHFSADTARVTLAGHQLTDSIEVVHEIGRVLVNGYQVYPVIPRTPSIADSTPPSTQKTTDLHRAHQSLILGFYALADWSDEAGMAYFRRSALVESVWVADGTLYILWRGAPIERKLAIGRTPNSDGPVVDRSQEYYTLLTTYLRDGQSVYLGGYLVAFPRQHQSLERAVIASAKLAPAAPGVHVDPMVSAKYACLIEDLRHPRDLNDLKRR